MSKETKIDGQKLKTVGGEEVKVGLSEMVIGENGELRASPADGRALDGEGGGVLGTRVAVDHLDVHELVLPGFTEIISDIKQLAYPTPTGELVVSDVNDAEVVHDADDVGMLSVTLNLKNGAVATISRALQNDAVTVTGEITTEGGVRHELCGELQLQSTPALDELKVLAIANEDAGDPAWEVGGDDCEVTWVKLPRTASEEALTLCGEQTVSAFAEDLDTCEGLVMVGNKLLSCKGLQDMQAGLQDVCDACDCASPSFRSKTTFEQLKAAADACASLYDLETKLTQFEDAFTP